MSQKPYVTSVYSDDVDILAISFTQPDQFKATFHHNYQPEKYDNFIFDIDKDGRVLGIEILYASKTLSR